MAVDDPPPLGNARTDEDAALGTRDDRPPRGRVAPRLDQDAARPARPGPAGDRAERRRLQGADSCDAATPRPGRGRPLHPRRPTAERRIAGVYDAAGTEGIGDGAGASLPGRA